MVKIKNQQHISIYYICRLKIIRRNETIKKATCETMKNKKKTNSIYVDYIFILYTEENIHK